MTPQKSRKTDLREIERLRRLLDAERQRAEKAWQGYREALYENVAMRLQLDEIKQILQEGGQ